MNLKMLSTHGWQYDEITDFKQFKLHNSMPYLKWGEWAEKSRQFSWSGVRKPWSYAQSKTSIECDTITIWNSETKPTPEATRGWRNALNFSL